MTERKYGYKHTEVNGTEFTIKETFEGTDISSAARRLATRDDIHCIKVEHTGVITAHVQREDHWNLSEVVPEGFTLVDAYMHPSGLGGANAHVDIERE